MPYHLLLDHGRRGASSASSRSARRRRGIGPCYADKAARLGIRVQDLLDEKILKKKIVAALEPKRLSLRPFAKDPALDLQAMTEEYLTYGHRLEQYIADTAALVHETASTTAARSSSRAPRATLLDIDHGTYPFVTSSNPVAGAACVGAGVGPEGHRRGLGRRQGLRHARRRRARSRPSSTTSSATTSASAAASSAPPPAAPRRTRLARPRRAALRRAHQHADRPRRSPSSTCSPASTRCRVCTRYRGAEGAEFDDFPYHQSVLHHADGEYERAARLERGHRRVPHARRTCPQAAREYLDFIAEFVGVPVVLSASAPAATR